MTKPNKKRGFRKIVVNDIEFSWRFNEIIYIRVAENKSNRLIVDFGWYDVWLYVNALIKPPEYNPKIITPKFVAESIKYALKNGWDMEAKSCEFKVRFSDNKYSVFKPELKYRISKQKWNQSEFGQMTFENICHLFSSEDDFKVENHPPILRRYYVKNEDNKYAVSWDKYDRKATFSGYGRSRTNFILQGKCNFKINEQTTLIQEGEYFELPSGKFEIEIRETTLEIVSVCELPEDFSIAEANKTLIDSIQKQFSVKH